MDAACHGKEHTVDEFLDMYLKIHGFSIVSAVLPLLNCRAFTFGNPDWCIKDDKSGKIQSLGENKRAVSTMIPEGQLSAEVIAADQKNRILRLGHPNSTMPANYHVVTFLGLSPTFYIYCIRQDLQQGIIHSTHPKDPTFVS
jgi:hypothetical protein